MVLGDLGMYVYFLVVVYVVVGYVGIEWVCVMFGIDIDFFVVVFFDIGWGIVVFGRGFVRGVGRGRVFEVLVFIVGVYVGDGFFV